MSENVDDILTFKDLTIHYERVVLPEGWDSHFCHNEIVFYKLKINDGKMKIEKQLVIKSMSEICVYVYQLPIQIEKISNTLKFPMKLTNLSHVIQLLDLRKICEGGLRSIDFPGVWVKYATLENNKLWRHQKCPILIDTKTKKCSACKYLINYLRRPMPQKLKQIISRCYLKPTGYQIVRTLNISYTRLQSRFTKLRYEIMELREKQRRYQMMVQNQF